MQQHGACLQQQHTTLGVSIRASRSILRLKPGSPRDASVDGQGTAPEIKSGGWEAIRDLITAGTAHDRCPVLLAEPPTHWTTLRSLLQAGRITGPRVHDTRVAALCLSHGVAELWTADRDYSRFADLSVRNPLLDRA